MVKRSRVLVTPHFNRTDFGLCFTLKQLTSNTGGSRTRLVQKFTRHRYVKRIGQVLIQVILSFFSGKSTYLLR